MARIEPSLRLLAFLALGLLAPAFPVQALAQSNDITLSLGGIAAQSQTLRSRAAGSTQISADVSLGANYGHRILHAEFAALYAEIQFVALPNRSVTSATAIVPQNNASRFRRVRDLQLRGRTTRDYENAEVYRCHPLAVHVKNSPSQLRLTGDPGHVLIPGSQRLIKRD